MNAIILAAGLGSRLKDITKKTHKALLPVNDKPNLENTIQLLQEANIREIHIVTGYLAEQFEYLKDKYNCNIIHNPYFEKYNNLYSFYSALDYFGDSFVIDSDVVISKNIFIPLPKNSTYFLIQRDYKTPSKEWIPILDSNGTISEIIISDENKPSLLGISFWNKDSAIRIKNKFKDYLSEEKLLNPSLYWDNIPMDIIRDLKMKCEILSKKDAFEIDNIEHYQFVLDNFKK